MNPIVLGVPMLQKLGLTDAVEGDMVSLECTVLHCDPKSGCMLQPTSADLEQSQGGEAGTGDEASEGGDEGEDNTPANAGGEEDGGTGNSSYGRGVRPAVAMVIGVGKRKK